MLICYCKVTVVSDAACEASSSTEVTVGQHASYNDNIFCKALVNLVWGILVKNMFFCFFSLIR